MALTNTEISKIIARRKAIEKATATKAAEKKVARSRAIASHRAYKNRMAAKAAKTPAPTIAVNPEFKANAKDLARHDFLLNTINEVHVLDSHSSDDESAYSIENKSLFLSKLMDAKKNRYVDDAAVVDTTFEAGVLFVSDPAEAGLKLI